MPKKRKSEKIQCQYFAWRVRPKPSGIYHADGRSKTINAGRHSLDVRTRAEALQELPKLDRVMAEKHGLAPKTASSDASLEVPLSIADGRRLYEEHVSRSEVVGGTSASTQKRYRSSLDKLEKFAIEQRIETWNAITDNFVTKLADRLEKGFARRPKGYAPESIRTDLTTIKQAHKWLIESGYLVGVPNLKVKLRKVEGQPHYCYRREEVEAMLKYCQQHQLNWLHDIIVALACTGLRIGELASLRWSSFDEQLEKIDLVDERSFPSRRGHVARRIKNRRGRVFPIHENLRAVLRRRPRKSGYVFTGPLGGRLKSDVFTRRLKKDVIGPLAAKFPSVEGERGFKDGVAHSFRHYFCSTCANNNVPEQMVMSWLGHAESRMVRHYYHLEDRESKNRMSQIDFFGTASERFAGDKE